MLAFRRWRQSGDPEAKYWIDLWSYCFIRRYFTVKFVGLLGGEAADLDAVMEEAYRRVQAYTGTVKDESRYAQWVSVVCKRTFLNYLRRRPSHVSLDEEQVARLRVEASGCDPMMVLAGVNQAIDRLPPFLQEVARLRFIKGFSYEEIQQATGMPLPSIRTYVYKVLVKFRSDGQLLAFLEQSSDYL